jgi:hypothetical protein
LITYWPLIEEQMVVVFKDLIGTDDQSTARLIFRSIINQNIRITVMRSLLEKSPHHTEKGVFFDELLDEFGSLNSMRNKYAHGLWYTYQDTGRIFIEEETDTYHLFFQKREVTAAELDNVTRRFSNFLGKLLGYQRSQALADALLASSKTPPPPESGSTPEEPPPEAG